MKSFNKLNRRLHYWVSAGVALPLFIVVCSGLLLQFKKHWGWVQPPEQQGTLTSPAISFDQILAGVRQVPELEVRDWSDVRRLDVRPNRGLVKVWVRNGWEAQVDLGTGEVLRSGYRRSDLIEAIHDGSWFAGDWSKFGLFLPSAVGLLLLLCGGLWMFSLPLFTKSRRQTSSAPSREERSGSAVALSAIESPQAPVLSVSRLGHSETR